MDESIPTRKPEESARSARTRAILEVADQLGLSRLTIERDVRKGLPIAPDGTYSLEECRAWKQAQNVRPDSGRPALEPAESRATKTFGAAAPPPSDQSLERFRAARADEAEIRVAKLRSRMVDYDVACEAIARRFGVVRRSMLALPEVLADLLTVEQRTAMRAEIDRALVALATPPEKVADEALSE